MTSILVQEHHFDQGFDHTLTVNHYTLPETPDSRHPADNIRPPSEILRMDHWAKRLSTNIHGQLYFSSVFTYDGISVISTLRPKKQKTEKQKDYKSKDDE